MVGQAVWPVCWLRFAKCANLSSPQGASIGPQLIDNRRFVCLADEPEVCLFTNSPKWGGATRGLITFNTDILWPRLKRFKSP